jgi:hypothetical protein
MKKIFLLVSGIAFCAANLVAEEIDGHKVLYWRGGGAYWSDKEWSATADGSKQSWEQNAIAVINSGNINFPKTNPLEVYGIRWNSGNNFLSAGAGVLRLGEGGILFSKSMNCRNHSGANSLRLMASQTWTNASETTTYSIDMNASSYRYTGSNPFAISAEDDVVLTLAGKLTWNFNVQTLFTNADVRVVAPAKLAVTSYSDAAYEAKFNARTLTLDGSASTLVSESGGAAFMAQTLELKNGGSLTVNSGKSVGVPLDGIAGKIKAGEGGGTLAGVVAATSDGSAFPVEVAENSVLTLNCTWKGDARLKLSGSGTVRFAQGVIPAIDDTSFTGTIEIGGATVAVTLPDAYAFGKYTVMEGAAPTLRCVTERPPAAYPDGFVIATGVSAQEMTNGWKFAFWNAATGSAYGSQDVAIVLEGSSLKVKPSDPPRHLTVSTTENWMDWSKKWFVDDSGASSSWVDGSAVTLLNKNTTIYSDAVFGGLRWSVFSSKYFNAPGKCLYLKKGGIDYTSASTAFCIGKCKEFRLVESQSWNGPSDGMIYLGDYRSDFVSYYPALFTADENVHLIVSNGVYVALNCPGDFRNADVTLAGSSATRETTLAIDYSKRGGRDVMLNARTLTLSGNARATDQSATAPAEGYAIAKTVVMERTEIDSPVLAFAQTIANAYPVFGVETLSTVGSGLAGTVSGTVNLPESPIGVNIASGTTLSLAAQFENAQSRPGALVFSGGGTCQLGAAAKPYLFTAASIASFEGMIEVKSAAQLAVAGAIDFGSRLVLQDGAIVSLKLDRGDRITDWGEVKFPETGNVVLKLYRDDGIAAAEGQLDLGMDFSEVSAEDLAKIKIEVEDRQESSAYSVSAEPVVNASGSLCAKLASKISKENGSFGSMVWIGRDWAEASVPENWVIFPNGTAASGFNPNNHPASAEDVIANAKDNSIYMSAGWKIDLCGREWRSPDGRNNDSDKTSLCYGISNGTWIASQLMLTLGTIEVRHGAVFKANGTLRSNNNWILGSGATKASPFKFMVKSGGVADIGSQTRSISAALHNTDYIVEEGGAMRYYLKPTFADGKRTRFENMGELVFPYGLALANTSASTVGALEINQRSGVLRLSGGFSLTRAEGASSTCSVNLHGGTTVVSNDASFALWDFAFAADAEAAVEIPAGGEFSAADFAWGENASLEKKGEGVLGFAVKSSVESARVKLGEGVLLPAGDVLAKSLSVEFAGGAIGIEPGVSAENGLLATNGVISGTCRVRNLGAAGSVAATAFMTVSAENDPHYTSENVVIEHRNGRVAKGRVIREEITLGDVPCVRYSAEIVSPGMTVIVK